MAPINHKNTYILSSLPILLISMFLITSVNNAELDYHLDKTIHLSNANLNIGNLTGFVALKGGEAAFISSRLPQCNVTILRGEKFQEEVYVMREKDVVSQPRFDLKSTVALNKGYFGYIKNYARFTTFPQLNISGNVLTGRQKSIFSQSKKCPTITTHYSFTNRMDSRKIGNQSQCDFYSAGYLKQHNEKYILYAAKYRLYLLQYFGDTIIDQYQENVQQKANIYGSLQSYYQSTIVDQKIYEKFTGFMRLGESNWYRVVRKNRDQRFKSDSFEMYSPMNNIHITGLNTAISFNGNYLYRWQKLSTGIQALEWTNQDQHLPGFPLCISNDQTHFFQAQKNKITIFSYIQGNITKLQEHTFDNIFSIIQGSVDQNNTYLLFNAYKNSTQGFTTFCKMKRSDNSVVCSEDLQVNDIQRIEEKSEESEEDKVGWERFGKIGVNQKGYLVVEQLQDKWANNANDQQICLQWAIFSHASKFVSLCLNTTSRQYELRLQKAQTLQLLHSQGIYIGDLPVPLALKLIKNQYREQGDQPITDRPIFLLSLKLFQQWDNDQAYTLRYIVDGDYFIRDGAPFRDLGFWNIYTYGRYIVNFKYRNSSHAINKLRFFDYQSFKLIQQIPFDNMATVDRYHLSGYRNILMINQNHGIRSTHIYDLKKIVGQPDFYRGIIHFPYQHSWSIILPKSNIYYSYRTSPSVITDPLKLVIDISTLPIKEYRKMQTQGNIQVDDVQVIKYLQIQPLIIGRECQVIFFITNNQWLHKYQDCITQRKINKYRLQNPPGNQSLSYTQIYESDSKQSITLQSHQTHPRLSTILHSRLIQTPQQITWRQNKTQQPSQKLQHVNYIQTGYGTSVDKIYQSKLIYEPIQDVFNASYYYFVSFSDINVGDTCFATVGQVQQSGGKDAFIFFTAIQNNGNIGGIKGKNGGSNGNVGGYQRIYVPGEYAKVVEHVDQCKHIATYTVSGKVLVWSTSQSDPQPVLRLNVTRQNIQSIKFSGDSKIAIQTQDTLQILQIPANPSSIPSSSILTTTNPQKYALTKDGQITAYTTAPLTTIIQTTTSTPIRTFILPPTPNLSIIDLSFSQDNKLLITVSNLTVYVLTPTPCPQPFVNKNGICLCRDNEVVVGNGCQCVEKYVRMEGKCVCDGGKFVSEGGVCGCSRNATEVEGGCQCLDNFVKNGPYCACPNSFEFNADKLTCECPYGFIDKQQCVSCQFPCSTCSSSVSSCDSYAATFYLLIIGGALALIGLIALGIFCAKKKSKKDQNSQLLKEELQKD